MVRDVEANGVLVYVMGPSGAGKDTLIACVEKMSTGSTEARPLHVARRRITRPAGNDAENHQAVTETEFAALRDAGAFAMHWESHGLYYGIGREIEGWLAADAVVIVNGSRAYLPQAEEAFPQLVPVLIHVEKNVLRQRLTRRGREPAEAMAKRLARAEMALPGHTEAVIIDNSGPMENAVTSFRTLIESLREESPAPETAPSRARFASAPRARQL